MTMSTLANGIDESMSIDAWSCIRCSVPRKHRPDIMCQGILGRYFGMPVGIFRGGCLTGPPAFRCGNFTAI